MSKRDILMGRLAALVRSMKAEGLLTDQFVHLYSLKEQTGPFFLPDLMPNFIMETHATIIKLSKALEVPDVNLTSIYADSVKIKGSTECFGAGKMALASSDLYHGVLNGDREACVLAVTRLKEEHSVLLVKLQEVLELERRIIAHDGH